MNTDSLEYYKRLILEHNKTPLNYGKPEFFTHSTEAFNPLCGDRIQLYITMSHDVVKSVHFESKACALCKASASMMTDKILGQTSGCIMELKGSMEKMLSSGDGSSYTNLTPLDVFSSVSSYPSRVKCVLLPWGAVEKIIARKVPAV